MQLITSVNNPSTEFTTAWTHQPHCTRLLGIKDPIIINRSNITDEKTDSNEVFLLSNREFLEKTIDVIMNYSKEIDFISNNIEFYGVESNPASLVTKNLVVHKKLNMPLYVAVALIALVSAYAIINLKKHYT